MFPKNRSSLYKLVWSQPLYEIAKHYQVDEQWIIDECIKGKVPRPLQGYWRAVAKGNAPAVPPLPPLKEEQKQTTKTSISTVDKGDSFTQTPQAVIPYKGSSKRVKRVTSANSARGVQLFQLTKETLLAGPVSRLGYYRPTKRKLLDINVSTAALDSAEAFLVKFFAALGRAGLNVRLAEASDKVYRREISAGTDQRPLFLYPSLWKPSNASVILVEGICVGFSLVELVENVPVKQVGDRYVRDEKMMQWTRGKNATSIGYHLTMNLPCGLFKLQLYSPYDVEGWVKVFTQTKACGLISQIPGIVDAVIKAAPIIKESIALEKKRHEEWLIKHEELMREYEIREQIKRQENAIKESMDELNAVMSKWREDKFIEQFFDEATADILKLDFDLQENLLNRINAAKGFIKGDSAFERLMKWKTPTERLK